MLGLGHHAKFSICSSNSWSVQIHGMKNLGVQGAPLIRIWGGFNIYTVRHKKLHPNWFCNILIKLSSTTGM